MKPRIRKRNGFWLCGHLGIGYSPVEAYESWWTWVGQFIGAVPTERYRDGSIS